ncbi:hypothetical protein LCGC14_0395270 [marine sediment metagenome]|uniref:Uncharacterized protein n=1 Tax=marine sediment metagenome TaxID=412755 RepID=A0A0F9TGD1_9ZZZZ
MRDKERTMKGFACIPITFPNQDITEWVEIKINRIESMRVREHNLTGANNVMITMFSGEVYLAKCGLKGLKVALETQMEENDGR